jgi:hypothetical protein
MNDLSVTEGSNSPAGSDAISTSLDNYLRAIQAIVRSTNHKGADIASGAAVAIGAAAGEFLTVTGTTTITSFDSVTAGIVRTAHFSGVLTLTHSTNIQLPGSVNYTTAAGDVLTFRSLGSGQWKCVGLVRSEDPNPVPAVSRLVKASDTARSSTTVVAADPTLAGQVVAANTRYKFKLVIIYSGASGGIKIELRDTADGSVGGFRSGVVAYDADNFLVGSIIEYSTAYSMFPTGLNDNMLIVDGYIKGHATLARTLDLFWAQDTSDASPTTVREGSYFELLEI